MASIRNVSRQMRLAEVGVLGQRKIEAASVAVASPGFAGEIAERYLRGAGVCEVRRLPRGKEEKGEPPFAFREPMAEELFRGSMEALALLRSVLQSP